MGISSWKSGILSLISKARIRCGEKSIFFTHQTEPDYNKHELERNIEIIKKIIPEKYISCKPVIFSDKQIIQSANKIWNENNLNNFKVIGIHLGSNEFMKAKRWDINKFNELINKLYYENDDIKIVLFGGPDEYEYSKQIKNNRIINFVSKFDLITSSELIKKCSVFVSNDSGLMHIAAAQSVPVIAIFGPTIISKNRPYSEKSKVVSLNLDCQPCYKYNEQIECDRNFECIKNISVNTVYTEVIKKIND
jgi:heptosyltransferase-2